MVEGASAVLRPWSNFYIMIGSASAALTGLMFVVITLISRGETSRTNEGVATFSTPTLLHFCGALLVSAILVTPWNWLVQPAALLGLAGVYGVVHMLRVMLRAQRLSAYDPDLEDWISYTILPFAAYGAVTAGAFALPAAPVEGLFAIGGGTALLIFIGIRNAWDVVTFIVVGKAAGPPTAGPNGEPSLRADSTIDVD